MAGERWPITWGNRLVGYMESPSVDMPHYYGRWVAADGPAAVEFLAALRRAVDGDEGLDVFVSGLPGIAYVHPDDHEGEIDIRWDWSARPAPAARPTESGSEPDTGRDIG
jgi:hypothetical protein